ncbi:hypothetical protein KYY02_22290 [Streptomyces pimonensis]|uniref:Uncharacterized protein n=1 Tax=Streptomyces pimonensis TaxID=2860288 RepID=A0ABV4J5P7_9ACTN
MTRNALQRLFPRDGPTLSMHELSTRLIDYPRLGLDDHDRACQQIHVIGSALQGLEAGLKSGQAPLGHPKVSEEDLTRARDRHRYAEQYVGDLQGSRSHPARAQSPDHGGRS